MANVELTSTQQILTEHLPADAEHLLYTEPWAGHFYKSSHLFHTHHPISSDEKLTAIQSLLRVKICAHPA